MKRMPALVVALLTLLALGVGTAVGVVVADRDDGRTGPGMMGTGRSGPGMMGPGMMGPGMMGPGMMGSVAADGEASYLVEMVAHHQEAVEAAQELARSDRPAMRAFGESIVATQSAQIEQMQAWLEEWYPDQDTDADYQPMMRDLSGLTGDRLDQTFLEDMVGHHMAAVMMSQHLLVQGADHDDVAALAREIRDEQHAEIVMMQRWLARWFDSGWRHGPGMMGMTGRLPMWSGSDAGGGWCWNGDVR